MARPGPLLFALATALSLGAPAGCKKKRESSLAVADDAKSGQGLGDAEQGQPCAVRQDCAGGLACKAGKCSSCTADTDCSPVTCTLDTGRCRPEGQCETDAQCAMDEICDGGMCVFSGDLGDEDGGPCELVAVFFAFDSEALTPGTQESLQKAAACFSQQKGRTVYLEAHADDRGTEEYNILLTERRGQTVREFLLAQGVPTELMQVIAKGSLEAVGANEPSRAKERRVQFIWPQ